MTYVRAAAIIPLQPGATYEARAAALVDGKPVYKVWRFTTN